MRVRSQAADVAPDATAALIAGLALYATALAVAWLPMHCAHDCPVCIDEATRRAEERDRRRREAEHEWRHTVWGRKNCPFCDEDGRADE